MAIVPAAVTLEMARAAAEKSIGGATEDSLGLRLKNIVWVRPVIADQDAVRVHIGLYEEEDGQIQYRMYGGNDSIGEEAPFIIRASLKSSGRNRRKRRILSS